MHTTTMTIIRIHPKDNVAIAVTDLPVGAIHTEDSTTITLRENIRRGHKLALAPISAGEIVIKYGFPIGRATCNIQPGE